MSDLVRQRAVLQPAQLNALARDLLEGSFAHVWVQGEISNFSRPGSGHLYFTLKDERAQVRCALFKQKANYLRFTPRDGLQVLVRGRLTLYEARGDYQLVLEHMEEAGEGALRLAFEALKQRLAAEGLFAPERKRALPRLIRHLGLITSPGGAAVHDVLNVLARRFPMLPVDVLPVSVQGPAAASEIRAMLERAATCGRYDALLITRGGGSLEDLWSFNDEALVRAIVASPLPVVSAVGHEVDFSLSDFAADLRAATPSAAAELLVPQQAELLAHLAQLRRRLDSTLARTLAALSQRSDQAALHLHGLRPQLRLERGAGRLGQLRARLDAAAAGALVARAQRLRQAAQLLERRHPREQLATRRHQAAMLEQRLRSLIGRRTDQAVARLQVLGRTLHSVSPLATLSRGYAIVRDPRTGAVQRCARDVHVGDTLSAQLAEGALLFSVTATSD